MEEAEVADTVSSGTAEVRGGMDSVLRWLYFVDLNSSADNVKIVEFRSSNAYQSECPFAQWLVAEKENNPNMFAFWIGRA